MLRYVALLCLVTASLSAFPAMATKVNGKIVVTKELRESLAEKETKARDPKTSGYWNEPNGVRQVEPPRVDPSSDLGVVIFKEGAPAPGADEVSTVNVRSGSLEKNVVVIRPNSTIKFINVDPYDHELYSPGLDTFPPEKRSRKEFRPIDFKAAGEFEVKCKLLTHFRGWIVVTPATMVVEVAKNGTFSLEDMQPGKYTIKVFHNGGWLHEQAFEVEEKAKELQVEVKLDKPGGTPPTKPSEKKDGEKPGKAKKKGKSK